MPVPDRLSALSSGGCPPGEPWRIIRRFHRLSACRGLVAYALRTRAPLSGPPKGPVPFDLHVLGLPLAFILSQDQTLRCTIVVSCLYSESRVPPRCSLGVPFKRFLPSRRSRGAGILCWPQTFKELALNFFHNHCLPFVFSGCKSTTFFQTGKHFFQIFFIFLLLH